MLHARLGLSNDKAAVSNSPSVSAESEEGDEIAPVLRLLHKFYSWLGFQVGKHAVAVIVACTLLTTLCLGITATTKKENDLLAYAPDNARSRKEFALNEEFFDNHGQGVTMFVLITAKDNGTLIRTQHLNETVRVLDTIYTQFRMPSAKPNRTEGFPEFCQGFCQINEPVRQFYNGLQIQQSLVKMDKDMNPRVNLSYPMCTMFGHKFTIQPSFFGVEIYTPEELAEMHENNQTLLHNIKTANLIVLQEVERAGLSLQPLIVLGFLIMCGFAIVTTVASSLFVQQFTIHKITLAITACVCPLMAVATAFGIMFSCGVRFGPILAVTPLLILAIGVDDSFLMLHSWQRLVSRNRANPHLHSDTIEQRISTVVAETGSSITLSAVTNILAFGVGALTSPPEIRLFAVVNAFALFVDTFYSVTLYAAIMAVCGRKEMRQEELRSHEVCEAREKCRRKFYGFIDFYTALLGRTWVHVLVIMGLVVYWGMSILGCLQMGIDLTSEKFFLKDSDLLQADHLKQEYVVPHFTAPMIFVNRPGNLSDIDRVRQLNQMVASLEGMPESVGQLSTKYFARDFADFSAEFAEPDFFLGDHADLTENETSLWNFNDVMLQNFLNWPEYSYWRGFMKIRNESLQWRSAEALGPTSCPSGRLETNCGCVSSTFSEFNASIYYDDALFLDLVEVLPSVTWQSVVSTLICMTLVCLVFFVDTFTVSMAATSIFSICLGVIGCLYWSGATLDPILMAALIMSIGFSVDIPCHICHHYYKSSYEDHAVDTSSSEEETAQKVVVNRLRLTLGAVGFPVIQAGVSTNLCVLCFLIVPMYMGEIFVTCMLLSISLSLVHGLFILPVLFHIQREVKQWRTGRKATVLVCN